MKQTTVYTAIVVLVLTVLAGIYFGVFKEHFNNQKSILIPYENLQINGINSSTLPKETVDTMFIFADNKSDPKCCLSEYNSGYSTSRGCVCLTEQQKEYLTKNIVAKRC
jgi:hypothetical protein